MQCSRAVGTPTLCLSCRQFRSADETRCPDCGGALVEDMPSTRNEMVDAIVRERMEALLTTWAHQGALSQRAAKRLLATITPKPAQPASATGDLVEPPAREAPRARDRRAKESSPVASPAPPPEPAQPSHEAEHEHHEPARLFAETDVVHGAVEALTALDTTAVPSRWETEVRPLLYENIGWFIGTLFVIAGSVYGVREAWRTLGGVARHLIVAAALLGYHAGFVGIARLLAPRSATTGRVLGGIATALLPVVFVALSSLTALAPAVGVGASLVCAAVTALTLRSVARRFDSSASLSAVMLPLLVAEVPMSSLAVDAWARVALCFVGVAVTARAAHQTLPEAAPEGVEPGIHPLVAAVYATLALAIFALSGASDGGGDFTFLAPAFALWVAVFAAVIAGVAATPGAARRSPPAASVVEVLSLAAVAIATIWGAGLALKVDPLRTIPGALASATALVATLAFVRSAKRHGGALHFVPLAATAATTFATRAIAPVDPAWWTFGAMLAPSVAMLVASRYDGEAHVRARTVVTRWSVVLSIAIGVAAIGVGAAAYGPLERWTATAAAFAVLSLSAHASTASRRLALHQLGALAAVISVFTAVIPTLTAAARFADVVAMGSRVTLAATALASVIGMFLGPRDATGEKRSVGATVCDSLASTAHTGFVITVLSMAAWISAWDPVSRPRVVEGGVLLALAALVAFVGKGFAYGDLRGSDVALWAAGGSVALSAVANRIGRPLPPEVVGWRLSVIAVALWLLARLLVATGPRIATWLRRPARGRNYHLVAHAGVFALGLLLVVDAMLVGSPSIERALLVTPPTMLLGAALAAMLLGRSTRVGAGNFVAHGLAIMGAALLAVQGSPAGRPSVSVLTINAPHWVPAGSEAARDAMRWSDPLAMLVSGSSIAPVYSLAVLGVAITAALFGLEATLLARSKFARRGASSLLLGDGEIELPAVFLETPWVWSAIAATLVSLSIAWRPDLVVASLVALSGALLLGARARRAGAALATVGVIDVIHAVAAREASLPWWTGVATMTLATALVYVGPPIAKRYAVEPAKVFDRVHTLATLTSVVAVIDALATLQPPTASWFAADLAWGAALGLVGRWMRSPSLPITLAVATWATAVAASQWRGVARRDGDTARMSAISALLAGVSACAGLTVAWSVERANSTLTVPFARGFEALRVIGAPLALTAALTASATHVAGRLTAPRSEPMARGVRVGRDVWLAASVGFLALFSALSRYVPEAPPSLAVPVAVAAMTVGVITAGHAAWREATGRHVYFVQTAIVAVYGVVRSELARDLAPEVDAIFALTMGFLLVGVTVQARRAGIPPVAVATRRFAALLPFAVALILPQEASVSSALAAAASALLYAALGWVERSRLMGSLGAAAANLALLLFALSSGISGAEVWLAPMGLFVLALSQIFASTLQHGARVALRVVGALLLYLPAALQIALQVGNARDGIYPVVFGLACLAGVAAGMLMQIRAYLALGVGFLVLDVVANLAHAGLRDHRVGFLVLSLSGIAILGGMVFTTLRREAFRAWIGRWRTRLRGWD